MCVVGACVGRVCMIIIINVKQIDLDYLCDIVHNRKPHK